MKYKELLNQLKELSKEQLELETLVMIRDKDKFVSLKSGLFYVHLKIALIRVNISEAKQIKSYNHLMNIANQLIRSFKS